MKEVREQQLCDQRRHIEEKNWLDKLQMRQSIRRLKDRNQGYRSGTSNPNSN